MDGLLSCKPFARPAIVVILALSQACDGGSGGTITAPPDGSVASDAMSDHALDVDGSLLGDASPPASTACVEMLAGPAGGTLRHPKGAALVVPEGALAAETRLSFCGIATSGLPLGQTVLGQGFEARPAGQTFFKPVEVQVPFDATRLSSDTGVANAQLRMRVESNADFVALDSTADLSTGRVAASTTYLSQFVPVQSTANPVFIKTPPTLPQATVGVPYTQAFAASGGAPPYTWSVPSTSSTPPKLVLDVGGTLGGIPTIPSNYAFFVAVSDSVNNAVQMAVSLTVVPPNNPVPTLTATFPSSAMQGSGTVVVSLAGSDFVPTSRAQWDGAPLPTTFVSSTQLAASVPAVDLVNMGSHQLTVFNPAPGGGVSAPLTFLVISGTVPPAPIPVVNSVDPSRIAVSTVDTQVTIHGADFVAASKAVIGMQEIPTSYSSATQLLATIPASYLSTPGAVPVGAYTPPPGGGYSVATATIIVGDLNPIPTISVIAPASTPAGSAAFTMTLTGTGFVAGGQGFLGSTALTTNVTSATSAELSVPAYLVTTPGSADVTFVNPPPGGGASNAAGFRITRAADGGGPPVIAWSQVPNSTPWPSRRQINTGMVPLGGALFVFGGYGANTMGGGVLTDTWVWDGLAWSQPMPQQVPTANNQGFAVAALGNKAIIFGGSVPNPSPSGGPPVALDETWEWDGMNWTKKIPAHSPPARMGHMMTVLGGKIVLFGGYQYATQSPVPLVDTWTWDGTDWKQEFPATSPGPHIQAAFAAYVNKAVMFGGSSSASVSDVKNETWEWDGNNWTKKLPPNSPSARLNTQMSALGGALILFGGFDSSKWLNDTWSWDGISWTLLPMSTPPPGRASAPTGTLGSALYMFSGACGDGSGTNGDDFWKAMEVCTTTADCSIGFCVSGVCCNTSCSAGQSCDTGVCR